MFEIYIFFENTTEICNFFENRTEILSMVDGLTINVCFGFLAKRNSKKPIKPRNLKNQENVIPYFVFGLNLEL